MGRIIAAVALGGWAAIVAIAYHLAQLRLLDCTVAGMPDTDCVIRLTTQRDNILTLGLIGALLIIVASLTIYAISARRQAAPRKVTRQASASRGQQARLR